MYRGVVTAIDTAGLWVRIAEQGVVGPLPWTGQPPIVGGSVLVADAGQPGQPDLIVVGTVPGTAATGWVTSAMIANATIVDADVNASAAIAVSKLAGHPTTTTDNTVPRFDGVAGSLQTSGVTIADTTNVIGGVGKGTNSDEVIVRQQIQTGTTGSISTGNYATVTFSPEFGSTPHVMFSLASFSGSALYSDMYVSNKSASGCRINNFSGQSVTFEWIAVGN